MTKEQLKTKIDELVKDGHRLTEDEIISLGREHKTLPLHERDWAWLALLVGYPSGEGLRSKVKRATAGEKPSAQEPEGDDSPEAKVREYLKERQRLRDERGEYARLLRDEARVEAFKEAVAEAARGLKPLLPPTQRPKAVGEVEAVALFSDLHIGVQISDYCNVYDADVAAERVAKWADAVVAHCRANGVSRLNVLNLGDLIQGVIHVTLRLQQQFDVVSQVMRAGELLAEALGRLQAAAPQVVYRSCTDNHSRVVADKTQSIEKENLGRLIDWFIAERLKGTSIEIEDDNLSPDLGRFKLMNGKTAMFSHGHLDPKNKVFQNYVGATREFVDYIFLGHYHCSEQKHYQNCAVFINGSIVGPDQYARDNRLFGDPSQKLVVFRGGDVIDIDIGLR